MEKLFDGCRKIKRQGKSSLDKGNIMFYLNSLKEIPLHIQRDQQRL